MTRGAMINAGMIIEVDFNYLTNDGRILYRVYRGSSTVWQVNDEPYLYRSLYEAYREDRAFAKTWNSSCYRVQEA